jgi:hypothetical protein
MQHSVLKRTFSRASAALCASAWLLPALAWAEPVAVSATRADEWQFSAMVYLYYPDIASKVDFPNGGSSDISVDASDVYNNLRFGVLGSFEARKGEYGLFTDLIYMDAGAFRSSFRDLSIGHVGLPADASASVNFDFKSTIWTLAATYRLVTADDSALDVFAGARYLHLQEQMDWTLNGNVGQIPLPGRAGTQSAKDDVWDGIIGLKGRLAFGKDLAWFVPYYGDLGTGGSDVTWQAMAGLGYAFKWGDIIGGWRYLDYQFKSSSNIDSMSLNGPMLGVSFHW